MLFIIKFKCTIYGLDCPNKLLPLRQDEFELLGEPEEN